MIECDVELKNWGNSIGVIFPSEMILKEGLKAKDKVHILVRPLKTIKVRDILGKVKIKGNTAKILKEIDKELDTKFS